MCGVLGESSSATSRAKSSAVSISKTRPATNSARPARTSATICSGSGSRAVSANGVTTTYTCAPSGNATVSGRVYSSGENGLVWRYDPTTDRVEETNMRLPGEYYESLKSIDFPVF